MKYGLIPFDCIVDDLDEDYTPYSDIDLGYIEDMDYENDDCPF